MSLMQKEAACGFPPLIQRLPVFPFEGLISLRLLLIMLRGLKLLHSASWGKSRNIVEWRERGLIELLLPSLDSQNLVYVLGEDTTFKDLTSREIFKNMQFKFPKDFNPETKVSRFLLDEGAPLSIEITSKDRVFFLNNHAKTPENASLMRGMARQRGMIRLATQKGVDMGQTRSVLTQAYLKLQAEAYCKSHNYTAKTELTPAIREELLNYLCHRNQTNEREDVTELESKRTGNWAEIQQTQQQIRQIEANADKILRFYQWGAIGVTALHIASFGYMIFFVDWLGWDIIEPITFSVSCLYLLIALRFYRRFRRDRNQQTIRERFRELILTPKKIMRLRSAQANLQRKQEQLKETELKLLMARNRLNQMSTLTHNLLQ